MYSIKNIFVFLISEILQFCTFTHLDARKLFHRILAIQFLVAAPSNRLNVDKVQYKFIRFDEIWLVNVLHGMFAWICNHDLFTYLQTFAGLSILSIKAILPRNRGHCPQNFPKFIWRFNLFIKTGQPADLKMWYYWMKVLMLMSEKLLKIQYFV